MAGGGNGAETGRSHIDGAVRLVEVGAVEDVENLPSELQVETVFGAEAVVLRDTHIPDNQAGPDNGVAPGGPEAQGARGQIHVRGVAGAASWVARFHDVAIRIVRVVLQRRNEIG